MSRDWRVDSLRGYFLVIMTLAHLPRHPLGRFMTYTFGFASAPDGFVFLSGLVSAWVYVKVRNQRGQAAMEARVLRRTRELYFFHILLLSLGIIAAVLLKDSSFQNDHPIQSLFAGALFLYQPGYSFILPMYCIFLLFTPLVLDQMMKGRAWLVGVISLLLWVASQRGWGDATHVVPWIDLGGFNLLAWQAYFVAGQYLASRQLRGLEVVPKSGTLLAICIVVAVFLFGDRHFEFFTGQMAPLKFAVGTGHNPVRFLNAACLGYILWWIPRTLDLRLMQFRLFKFLNLLGRHSLQVFVFSLFVTVPWPQAGNAYWLSMPEWAKAGVALATVLSLAIPAWLRETYRTRGRSKVLEVQSATVTQSESISIS